MGKKAALYMAECSANTEKNSAAVASAKVERKGQKRGYRAVQQKE